jgi:hypothetical protein
MAAVAVAAAAGGLAAFALRPDAGTSTATLAARNPAVEVRTQVIRRTIHVIRHEPAAPLRGARGAPPHVVNGKAPAHGHARTAASGAHHAPARGTGSSGVVVSTRASGSHASSSPAPASSHPVSSHPVSTRASGSHGATPSPGPTRPLTRSSGGGHKHEDGGDDHSGRDD